MGNSQRVAQARTADLREVLKALRIKVPANNQIVCPWHSDHRPSMKVYDMSAYCFACHKHADNIDFVREILGYSFEQAVGYLVENFDVYLPEEPEAVKAILPPKDHLFSTIPRERLIEASEEIDLIEFAYSSGQLSRVEAAREILGKVAGWRSNT